MNVQEKMTMLKCYAYQKRESQGMEGKEAGMLEKLHRRKSIKPAACQNTKSCTLKKNALRSSRKNRRKFSNGCII